ncbi:MAG: hypothetical protein WCX30_02530 [Candidatus Paceibacterota bacterium]|jgi:hypothetical protein
MNLKDIKNLINEEGGKLIIADDNGPAMVIMPYSDYKKLKNIPSSMSIEDPIEQLPIIKDVSVPREKKESFGVEDLPF